MPPSTPAKKDEDQDRVDTMPPPPGEPANIAATVLREVPPDVMRAARQRWAEAVANGPASRDASSAPREPETSRPPPPSRAENPTGATRGPPLPALAPSQSEDGSEEWPAPGGTPADASPVLSNAPARATGDGDARALPARRSGLTDAQFLRLVLALALDPLGSRLRRCPLPSPLRIPTPAAMSILPFRIPRPAARVRLLCFPFAGGGAMIYRGWDKLLPADVDVCAVELPGRGARQGEAPIDDMNRLLDDLAPDIEPLLDRPVVLFGHTSEQGLLSPWREGSRPTRSTHPASGHSSPLAPPRLSSKFPAARRYPERVSSRTCAA